MQFIEVLYTYNAVDIGIIKSILDGEKVEYRVKGEFYNAMEPPVQPVSFFIREDQVDIAKDLLKEMDIIFISMK